MFKMRKRWARRQAELRGDLPREVSNDSMFRKLGYTPEIVN